MSRAIDSSREEGSGFDGILKAYREFNDWTEKISSRRRKSRRKELFSWEEYERIRPGQGCDPYILTSWDIKTSA